MSNSSMLSKICELTERIYMENSAMRNVFIAELISSISAILVILLILLAVLFNKTLHFNMRLLLICLCGAFMVANIGSLLDSVYYLVAILLKVGLERCAWLSFTKSDCIALRNVYYLGSTLLVASTLFLSIERVVATLLYRTYERGKRRWIGILMATIQWLLIVPLLYYQDQDEGHIFPYCAYELFNPHVVVNIQLGLIIIQICSFVIIVVLWMHNNKKILCEKSQYENISVRYQLRENVSTTKVMIPIVAMMTLLVLSGTLLHIIVLPLRKKDDHRLIVDQLIAYCWYAAIQACFMPITTIILAITFFRTSPTIRRSLFDVFGFKNCLEVGRKNLIYTSPDEFIRQAYFDELQRQWKNPSSLWNNTIYCSSSYNGFRDIKCNKYQYID